MEVLGSLLHPVRGILDGWKPFRGEGFLQLGGEEPLHRGACGAAAVDERRRVEYPPDTY